MKTLGDTLKASREEKDLILRKVAAEVDIDQSLISKFEKNERKPTMEQIVRLAKFYGLSESELIIDWYSEKIAEDLKVGFLIKFNFSPNDCVVIKCCL